MVTVRLHIPCFLQMCHSSCFFTFGVLYFFFLVVVFLFFVSIFVFIVLFTFDSVVSLSCILSLCDKKPDQITEYLKF